MDPTIELLLRSADPSIRFFTLTDVLDESPRAARVREARAQIQEGPRVRAVFRGWRKDGGFGAHTYRKWTGSHWRLIALAELGADGSDPRIRVMLDRDFEWLGGKDRHPPTGRWIEGRYRHHVGQEGKTLAACVALGAARDPRTKALAARLLEWQWPDGGWNCDVRSQAKHSDFDETWGAMWGLAAFHRATGDPAAGEGARGAAEFLLRHGLFRSESSRDTISAQFLRLRYPPYYHYDILAGLRMLAIAGVVRDERATEALDVVEAKRKSDGSWHAEGYWWRAGSNPNEVVDWGRGGTNEFVTLNALRVLKAAGRLG